MENDTKKDVNKDIKENIATRTKKEGVYTLEQQRSYTHVWYTQLGDWQKECGERWQPIFSDVEEFIDETFTKARNCNAVLKKETDRVDMVWDEPGFSLH